MKHSVMLTMKESIALFPAVNRRTLTRDLNHLIKLGLLNLEAQISSPDYDPFYRNNILATKNVIE